jgi:hypothetical protein
LLIDEELDQAIATLRAMMDVRRESRLSQSLARDQVSLRESKQRFHIDRR